SHSHFLSWRLAGHFESAPRCRCSRRQGRTHLHLPGRPDYSYRNVVAVPAGVRTGCERTDGSHYPGSSGPCVGQHLQLQSRPLSVESSGTTSVSRDRLVRHTATAGDTGTRTAREDSRTRRSSLAIQEAESPTTPSPIYPVHASLPLPSGHGRPEPSPRLILASSHRINRPCENASAVLEGPTASGRLVATHSRRSPGECRRPPLREDHRKLELYGREIRARSCSRTGRSAHNRDKPCL